MKIYPKGGVIEGVGALGDDHENRITGIAVLNEPHDKPVVPELVSIRPRVIDLVDSALALASAQIEAYHAQIRREQALSPTEVNAYSRLVDAISKLAREEREHEKANGPATWTMEEIGQVLGLALKAGLLPPEVVAKMLPKGEEDE